MATVTFNYAEFIAAYPMFNQVSEPALTQCFVQSCLILNNTDSSVVANVTDRKTLLYLLVAHIATLQGLTNANIAAGTYGMAAVLGRTSSASEGSVSISTDYHTGALNGVWFNQTQYGAAYWQMILPYRSFRYRAATTVIM